MFGKIIGIALLVLGIIFFCFELKNLIVSIKSSRQARLKKNEDKLTMADEVNIKKNKGE